jgi:hypothetical protein
MKTILKMGLLPILLVAPLLIQAQGGLVNNGANIKITTTTELKVDGGGVFNKANGAINNEGNLYLDLNWAQSGATTNYIGNGWMWFEGGINQNLGSVAPITIPRLRVDNGNRLFLNDNVNVSQQVDLLNNGSIELGTSNLVLLPGATIVNYDPNNYIITNNTGTLQQEVGGTNVTFPIGNSTYNPAVISNTGVLDNIMARVEDQVWDHGTTGTPEIQDIVNRTWHVAEQTTGGSSVNLTVQWDVAQELVGFDRTQSGVAHFEGAYWTHPTVFTAASPVGASFTQTKTGINSFSPFAVEDLREALPIELLFFEAHRLDRRNVQLNWATQSETNNEGFEVERMLDNETEFSKIDWVDGFGTTTNVINYSINDVNPHQGVSYYRLKQIDFDGSFSYSPVRAVDGYKTDGGTLLVYPVPTRNVLNVDFSNWTSEEADVILKVIDVYGRTLITKNVLVEQNSLVQIQEVESLSAGTYFLIIDADKITTVVRKFTKTEE